MYPPGEKAGAQTLNLLLCIPEGLARLLVELAERIRRQLSSCASELTWCSVHSQQCTRVLGVCC